MKITQIQQFLEVANTGTVSKAAENLYISQPSLSLSLHKMEEEIGQHLFNRTSKGLTLTDFGKNLLLHCENVISDFNQLEDFCKTGKKEKIVFSIAVFPQEWIYKIFAEFVRKYEKKALYFSLYSPIGFYDIIAMVQSGKSELGIINIPPREKKVIKQWLKKKQMEYTPISTVQYSIMIGKNNPYFFNKINHITKEMLKDFPLVIITGNTGDATGHQRICREAGLMGNEVSIISVDTTRAMQQVIENTNAFTLTIHSIKAYRTYSYNKNLRSIPLADCNNVFEQGWIRDSNRVLSSYALDFLKNIQELFK